MTSTNVEDCERLVPGWSTFRFDVLAATTTGPGLDEFFEAMSFRCQVFQDAAVVEQGVDWMLDMPWMRNLTAGQVEDVSAALRRELGTAIDMKAFGSSHLLYGYGHGDAASALDALERVMLWSTRQQWPDDASHLPTDVRAKVTRVASPTPAATVAGQARPPYVVATTPREVEHNVMCWLLENGHPDAYLTPEGADGGVDVRGAGLVVHVKAEWGRPVGREVIQQISGIGAHEGARVACFSWSGFTPQAHEWSAAASVALLRIIDRMGTIERMNRAADAFKNPLVPIIRVVHGPLDELGFLSAAALHALSDELFFIARNPNQRMRPLHLVGHETACALVAMTLARALETTVRIADSQQLQRPSDCAAVMSSLSEGEILLLQNPVGLRADLREMIEIAREQGKVEVVVGKGTSATAIRLEVARFNLMTSADTPSPVWQPSLYLH